MKLLQIVKQTKNTLEQHHPVLIDDIFLDKKDKKFRLKYGSDDWRKKFAGKTIWMINSTAEGGGVAEMMSWMISKWEGIGCNVKWAVINVDKDHLSFFDLTKRIHNLIHGDTKVSNKFTKEHRAVFEKVNELNAQDLITNCISKDDIIVVHDPQPSALIKFIKKNNPNQICIWRSHIGLHYHNEATKAVWNFLEPYLSMYDELIFTTCDYIPLDYKKTKPWTVVHPSISPYNSKNEELSHLQIMEVFANCGLIKGCKNPEGHLVKRVNKAGKLVDLVTKDNSNFGFLFQPIILQISRWDKLKGWIQLMKGFVEIKNNIDKYLKKNPDNSTKEEHKKFLESMVLFLCGPDPSGIQDDPEGCQVFEEIKTFYGQLDESVQKQVFVLSLPMDDKVQNALIVNALQRNATIIVQNSIQEGFGLTCTEALWKGKPVVGTTARGLVEQIKDGKNGLIIDDPKDPKAVALKLNEMCISEKQRKTYGKEGKHSVFSNFMVWKQCSVYLDLWEKYL